MILGEDQGIVWAKSRESHFLATKVIKHNCLQLASSIGCGGKYLFPMIQMFGKYNYLGRSIEST